MEAHAVTSTAGPSVPPQAAGTAALLALPQPETVTPGPRTCLASSPSAHGIELRGEPLLSWPGHEAPARHLGAKRAIQTTSTSRQTIRQNRPRLSQDHVGGPAEHQLQEGHRRSAPITAMSRRLQDLVEPWIQPLDLDGLNAQFTSHDAAILIQRYGYWPCEVPPTNHCSARTWAFRDMRRRQAHSTICGLNAGRRPSARATCTTVMKVSATSSLEPPHTGRRTREGRTLPGGAEFPFLFSDIA